MRHPRLEPVNRIIIQAGHGGLEGEKYDPGAIDPKTGAKENVEVKQIISLLASKLTKCGLTVVITPDFGLRRAIEYINVNYDSHTDWALEIHKDSAGPKFDNKMIKRMGVYYHPESYGSKDIAEILVTQMKAYGANQTSWARSDTKSRFGKLGWIRSTKMLAHLIEAGFIEDRNDAASDEFYAAAITKSICYALSIEYVI